MANEISAIRRCHVTQKKVPVEIKMWQYRRQRSPVTEPTERQKEISIDTKKCRSVERTAPQCAVKCFGARGHFAPKSPLSVGMGTLCTAQKPHIYGLDQGPNWLPPHGPCRAAFQTWQPHLGVWSQGVPAIHRPRTPSGACRREQPPCRCGCALVCPVGWGGCTYLLAPILVGVGAHGTWNCVPTAR